MSTIRDDPEFGHFSVVFERKRAGTKVCYFAGYSIFEDHPGHVYHYLQSLNDVGFEILFISSSPLSEVSLDMLKRYCYLVIEKENKGTDFGAWKVALKHTEFGAGLDSLILANDSVFGPFRSLKDDIREMSRKFDLWGYSSSQEVRYHVQSYFIHVGRKIVDSAFWPGFWNDVRPQKTKEDVIVNYEIGLTQKALAENFKAGAYVETTELYKDLKFPSKTLNYTISAWKELILKYSYPFLKKELFVKELAHSSNGGWKGVIETTFGPGSSGTVVEFLESFKHEFLAGNNIDYKISPKDIVVLSDFSGRVSPNQILALNLAAQICAPGQREFLCYELSNVAQSALRFLDGSAGLKYLGSISSGLLEQYIYYWNKFNVQAIIVDKDTFRMFHSYFESFFSGNILVVDRSGQDITISYHVRTTFISSVRLKLNNVQALSFEHCIRLKSPKSYLVTDEYKNIQALATSKSVSIIWDEWVNQISDDQPSEQENNPASLDENAEDLQIAIEFDGYNYTLISHGEIVYFTDSQEELSQQLELILAAISFDEFELSQGLSEQFFYREQIAGIYDLCFSAGEENICRSPATASFTHIFYEDTLYDLLPYLYNLSYLRNHRYFFSISEATINKREIAAKLNAVFPNAVIQIVKNSGKDISGKLVLLKLFVELGLSADYLLMLHDKKSLHSWAVEGNQWRNELFKIAEPNFIFEVFSRFENDGKLGVIGSQKWMNNTDYDYRKGRFAFHDSFFRRKLKEYKINIDHYEFVGGTMFWMKHDLLRIFYEKYSLLEILGKLEDGNILDSKDGTETHFLERFFGWFATSENYRLAGV